MGGAFGRIQAKPDMLNILRNAGEPDQRLQPNQRLQVRAQDVTVSGTDGRDLTQRFLNSHNLVQNDSWTHLFQRVHVSENQIKEAAPYAEHFTFDATVPAGEQQKFSLAKLDHDQRGLYTYYGGKSRKDALGTTAAVRAYEGFKEQLITDHGPDTRNIFAKLWTSGKDWVTGANTIQFTRTPANEPAEPLLDAPLLLAPGPAAEQALRPSTEAVENAGNAAPTSYLLGVQTASSRPRAGEGVKWDTGYQQPRTSKFGNFLWRAGPWILGVAAVAAAVVFAGPVLIAALGAMGAVGALAGGAVLLTVAGKLTSCIKNPLWAKTVLGQIQHHERREAGRVADEFSKMVKDQILFDQNHGAQPADAAPAYKNPELLKDSKKISDFVKVAKHQSANDLRKMVRAHVLSEESHLDRRTRDYAKSGVGAALFKNWWFTGNQKAHAVKTVEMVTNAITDGILRGIGEGSLELIELGLSDEATRTARAGIEEVVVPAIQDFQKLSNHLAEGVLGLSSMHDAEEPIHSVARRALDPNNAFDKFIEKAGTTRDKLHASASVVGEKNVANFDQALRDLSADATKQRESLLNIHSLVEGSNGHPARPALKEVNLAMVEILTLGQSPEEIDGRAAELTEKLNSVVRRLDTSEMAQTVTGDHAQRFINLVKQVQDAVGHATNYAKTLARAEQAIAREGLSPGDIENLQKELDDLSNHSAPNLDPLGLGETDVTKSLNDAATRVSTLTGACDQIVLAAKHSVVIDKTLEEAASAITSLLNDPERAGVESLAKLLEGEGYEHVLELADVQDLALDAWSDAGGTPPTGIRRKEASVALWRSHMAAASLGVALDENNQAVLARLGVQSGAQVLLDLRTLVRHDSMKGRQLLGELQANGLDDQPQAESAFKALALVRSAYGSVGLDNSKALALAQALYPSQVGDLAKLHAYAEACSALQSLTNDSGLCSRLLAWREARSILEGDPEGGEGGPALQSTVQQNMSFLMGALANFLDVNKDVAGGGTTLESVKHFKGLLDRHGINLGTPDDLGRAQAGAVAALELEHLHRVVELASVLSGPNSQIDQKTHDLNEKAKGLALRLRAVKQEQENKILSETGTDSVLQAVATAARPKADVDPRQFEKTVEELQGIVNLALRTQREIGASEMTSKIDLSWLTTALNFKGNADELRTRIEGNAELAREVALLMAASEYISAKDPPDVLGHKFSESELTKGAMSIASLRPTNFDQLGQSPPSGLRQRLDDRNRLIARFKDKSDTDIQKLLGNPTKPGYGSTGIGRQVTDFLYEERALRELQAITNPTGNNDPQTFREMVEHTHQRITDQHLDRSNSLGDVPLDQVQNNLRTALRPRLDALQSLIQGSSATGTNAANSEYVMGQLMALTEMVGTPDALRSAYRTEAANGGLIEVGRRFAEADRVRDKSPDQVKLAYMKGQFDSSRTQLKYFNPRTFEKRRPGFFGRLIFKLMDRGQRVDRLLRQDRIDEVKETIARIATNKRDRTALLEQYAAAQVALRDAQDRRDALFNKPEKVHDALVLKAIEHLQSKSMANPDAILGEADIAAVLEEWRDMVGAGAAAFPDVEQTFKKQFNAAGLGKLEGFLSREQRAAIQHTFDSLLKVREQALAADQAVLTRLQLVASPQDGENIDALFSVFRERNSDMALKEARESAKNALDVLKKAFDSATGKAKGKKDFKDLGPHMDFSSALKLATDAMHNFGRAGMYAGAYHDEAFDSAQGDSAEPEAIVAEEAKFKDYFIKMATKQLAFGDNIDLQNLVKRLPELSDLTATQDIRDSLERNLNTLSTTQGKINKLRDSKHKPDQEVLGMLRDSRARLTHDIQRGIKQLEYLVRPEDLVVDLPGKVIVAVEKVRPKGEVIERRNSLIAAAESLPSTDDSSTEGGLCMANLYMAALKGRRAIHSYESNTTKAVVERATTNEMLKVMKDNPFLSPADRDLMSAWLKEGENAFTEKVSDFLKSKP